MNSVQFILDVWESVRDNIPASKRHDAANGIITAALEYGFESAELAPIVDEDKDLAEAFFDVYHDGEHPHDEDGDE